MNIGKERRTILIEPIEIPSVDPGPPPEREAVPETEPARAPEPVPAGSIHR